MVYQGPEPWTVTTEFLRAVDLPQSTLAHVREFLPSFRYMLDDLSAQTDGAIEARGLNPLGTLGLLLLKHAREEAGRLLQLLASFVHLFNRLGTDDDRELVLSYLLRVVDSEPGEVIDALGSKALPQVREAVMTAAERLLKEGEARALRATLVRLLRRRFQLHELPNEIEERVANGGQHELNGWLDRVVTASTLDEVFGEDA